MVCLRHLICPLQNMASAIFKSGQHNCCHYVGQLVIGKMNTVPRTVKWSNNSPQKKKKLNSVVGDQQPMSQCLKPLILRTCCFICTSYLSESSKNGVYNAKPANYTAYEMSCTQGETLICDIRIIV